MDSGVPLRSCPAGSTLPSTSRSAGVLSRSAELEQLTARTAAMQAKLAEAKQAEEDTARELAAAQYELETAEAQRRHAEDEVLRLEGIRGQYDLLLRSLCLLYTSRCV